MALEAFQRVIAEELRKQIVSSGRENQTEENIALVEKVIANVRTNVHRWEVMLGTTAGISLPSDITLAEQMLERAQSDSHPAVTSLEYVSPERNNTDTLAASRNSTARRLGRLAASYGTVDLDGSLTMEQLFRWVRAKQKIVDPQMPEPWLNFVQDVCQRQQDRSRVSSYLGPFILRRTSDVSLTLAQIRPLDYDQLTSVEKAGDAAATFVMEAFINQPQTDASSTNH